jgi:uroporphyrinogen-III decarboxylase
MTKEWSELSPAEKRKERFKRWISPPGANFANPQAARAYKERTTRLFKALQLKEPDRVPVFLPAGFFAAPYAGTNLHTVMYDYGELKRAWLKFLHDFDADTFMGPGLVPPGRALDVTGYKLYRWPGHGLGTNVISYQAVEGEYMKASEYDALINDPSDFWLRIFFPRIFSALGGFQKIPNLMNFQEIATTAFVPFGSPDVQSSFQALLEAGRESTKWFSVVKEVSAAATTAGFPSIFGGLAKAPFDTLGDTLRGTQGIMMDMFQRPEKVQAAMERLIPMIISSAIGAADSSNTPVIFFPLHKGADSFMSVKQFETFYWPTLKKILLALVNEGVMPLLFAEGAYNKRLEVIQDLPKGSVAWYFDQTDIIRAKKEIGDKYCIIGNVPTSLMMTGTPRDVKEHCRKLIEICGKGGGYILAGGANIDEGNPENLRAMTAAAKEYGTYK